MCQMVLWGKGGTEREGDSIEAYLVERKICVVYVPRAHVHLPVRRVRDAVHTYFQFAHTELCATRPDRPHNLRYGDN